MSPFAADEKLKYTIQTLTVNNKKIKYELTGHIFEAV